MKKKVSSLLTIIFVLFACVFASACGDKYKKLEFKVYYAFSADAAKWYDGTDGISLNYDERETLEEGEDASSLIFTDGMSVLYIKVEIEGVKAKYLDTISISATSLGGLEFSGATVSPGTIVGVTITGNVDTTFKIYENNSNKKFETQLVIKKQLAKIELKTSNTTPAMLLGQNSSLNLLALNNLRYLSLDYVDEFGVEHFSEGETNQIGATYKVEGIGSLENGNYIPGTKSTTGIFSIDNGMLNYLVKDAENINGAKFKIDAENHVLKIRATSIFHPGTEEENYLDAKTCDFYVCLANTMSQPSVIFANNLDDNFNKVETVYLYQNGTVDGTNDYSTSNINIGPMNDLVYDVKIAIYVNIAGENEAENFVKYEFNSGNNEIVSRAGLTISKEENNRDDYETYKFGISNAELLKKNKVKVVYAIDGLDFSCGTKQPGETLFNVEKHIVPKDILLNNELVGVDTTVDVYYTTAKYDGVRLDIVATPNDDETRELTLSYNKNIEIRDAYKNLIATTVVGDTAYTNIKSGSSIYVKFNSKHMRDTDSIKISTSVQGNYDGGVGATVAMLEAVFKLKKVVTANSMSFVNAEGEEIASNTEYLLDAAQDGKIYLKVNYSNGVLEKTSIKIVSGNSNVKFANGSNEIYLSDNRVETGEVKTDGDNYHTIFAIPLVKTQSSLNSTISASAGNMMGGIVNAEMKLKTVVVAPEDLSTATVTPINMDDVLSFIDVGGAYAIKKGESVTFELANADWAFDLKVSGDEQNEISQDDAFDYAAVSAIKAVGSKFIVTGNIAGKTAVIKITPAYYVSNLTIPENRQSYTIQVAVYEPIEKVDYAFEGSSSISYINEFYKDISSTSFTFTGKTMSGGTPTKTLTFMGEAGEVLVENFSQVKISLEKTATIKVYLNDVDIVGDVLTDTSGKIKVELLAEENSVMNVAVVLTPFVNGSQYVYGETTKVDINITDAIRSSNLSLSGSNLDAENGVINMSFMNVADGGYDTKNIYATLEMEDNSINTDLKKNLTYLVYKYAQRADGSYVEENGVYKLDKVSSDAVIVDFEGNNVIIKAYKNFGGGRYVLVLAPKDAYMGTDLNDITRNDFGDMAVEVDLNVRDGSAIAPYQIANYNDFISINNNISMTNVHYELTNNLDLRGYDITPVGLVGNIVNAFQGTLNGAPGSVDNAQARTIHTIYYKVKLTATSTNYGEVAGLFALLGANATIKNLNLVVDFALETTTTYKNIGALAGANNGKIENVKVLINNSKDIVWGVASSVNFGGIVGFNGGAISNCKVEMSKRVKVNVGSNANIGLVAGENQGNISGKYLGKESLDNFTFDVVANLSVVNMAANTNLYIGGVAGANSGKIKKMLIGGTIDISADAPSHSPQNSYLGGFAGSNTNEIDTVAALSLNLQSTANGIDVGGIVGTSSGSVNYAKYITAQTVFGFGQINGQVSGTGLVAGIAGNASGTISYSSVESFILTKKDEANAGEITNYPTLVGGTTTAGILASGDASVSNSFVKANIDANNVILLAASSISNGYYIGYSSSTPSDTTSTYFVLYNFATSALIQDAATNPSASADWGTDEGINKVSENSYAYLLKGGEPLMILAPQYIAASLNENYIVKPGSVYVEEFDITLYENNITETILVNYLNNIGNEGNTHTLVNSNGDGLINIDKVPVTAQTGLRFEIIGDGYRYAYINENGQIVFTGVSGNTPILVRVYSVFNPDVESFVVFYSVVLASEINLGTEAINLRTGMGGKVLSMQAKNMLNDVQNSTLFDAGDLKQYLIVEASVKDKLGNDLELIDSDTNASNDSKLSIAISGYNNIFVSIKDDQVFGADYYEYVTLTLLLNKDYFATGANRAIVDKNIELSNMTIRVNLFNVSSSVNLSGNNEEMPTNGDLSFKAYMATDYISDSPNATFDSNLLNSDEINNKYKTLTVKGESEESDGLKVQFIVTDGVDEAKALVKRAGIEEGVDYFIDLFDIIFIRSLYENAGDVLGYVYEIHAELKDGFNYRYITSNIKFEIKVYAESNEDAFDTLNVTLKPTLATTASFKTYAVQGLDMNTDYTTVVTSETEESLIIEPGRLGNIFIINLQPSYAYINAATITSSELYVPSLNKNVRMIFTQLINRDSKWTTTLGTNTQQGNTLELQMISSVDSSGKAIYDGRICLYVQVESFSGLAGNLTATLEIQTSSATDTKTLVRTKMLTTTYLPSVDILFEEDKEIAKNQYFIENGTSNNVVDIRIQGYQFNADPIVSFSWVKFENGQYIETLIENKPISDYVTWYFVNNKSTAVYNAIDDSYTISLKMSTSKDMPSAFKIKVGQSLVGKDGSIATAEKQVIFNPVDYYLNSIYVSNINLEINQEDNVNIVFNTDNSSYNPVGEFLDLLALVYPDDENTDVNETELALKKMFTYIKDGNTYSFADSYEEFVVDYDISNKTLSLQGLKTFSAVVTFAVEYYYELAADTGTYSLKIGTAESPLVKSVSFNLDITPVNTEAEILVRSEEDIFANGQWKLVAGANYVLLEDITLENVVPITTAIKSFDGNNRTISIKSYQVNDATSKYGLFAEINEGTTIKNVMVDYSKMDTLALNNNTTSEVVFGGLVAENKGGIIYNCDVINKAQARTISIIVSDATDVVFGGLVGRNNGIITNSRVGRSSYTRVAANKANQIVYCDGLTFEIFNKMDESDTNNKFDILAGGFVGENSGTISTSYVAQTSVINYSNANTAQGTNQTAGFVARNSGEIKYSYVRADENTVTYSNPNATGYEITNKGNGIVAGFVFENSGTISNAYANTELKTDSAYISGFVYTNTGTIGESYAACTMNAGNLDSNAEQPFIGLNEENKLQSFGTIRNSYYLTRSENDVPIQQGDKDIAYGLDYTNFQNSEYLVGFAFVLTSTKAEREQGIWSYYSIDGKQRALPELINADKIAISYRYLKDMGDGRVELTNVADYKPGKATNPYTIASAEDFNRIFKSSGNQFTGHVRFINNIDFENLSVQTRTNFVLGATGESTSIEGNGMTISNIYLEADETILDKIGLFAEIENAYVKNLNLDFVDAQAGDNFSTTTAVYSGGLSGKINDSVILNINLYGNNTTLTGKNFVGGLSGLISGDSLIYGASTNLSVLAAATGDGMFYSKADFDALNIAGGTSLNYDSYLKTLSYAGGIAGVIDINTRANSKYNLQYIDVMGNEMPVKENKGSQEANIMAEYAGGVAGHAGMNTDSYRVRYFTGDNELIIGDTAVGGIYGVLLGDMTACQVAAEEDTQFDYDTLLGEYVTSLYQNETATLNKEQMGNLHLLNSNKYAGGLVGVALGARLKATYAKVGISSGSSIGGLIGSSVSSVVNYSYAIPYVDVENLITETSEGIIIPINIGGLMGEAHAITSDKADVGTFIKLLKHHSNKHQGTDIQFAYSTLAVDDIAHAGDITMDYIVAEYLDGANKSMIQSNASPQLVYVYAGTVDYKAANVLNQTMESNASSIMPLHKLYPNGDDDVAQQVAFQDVFSAWSVIKYWSLKKEKYFPLLKNDLVNNLIEIENENDLINKISNNPDGDFIIVNDIVINEREANWIINPTFTGTITGARKSDNRRPVIYIKGLKPTIINETTGFFRGTRNAKITNIEIVWGYDQTDEKGGFNITNGMNISMVSGLVCEDENSLISNVMVSGHFTGVDERSNNGYVLNSNQNVQSFAGIVGFANRTNIMGCGFAGNVYATFGVSSNSAYFGGIAANIETGEIDENVNPDEEKQNAIISNSFVGVTTRNANPEIIDMQYPTTTFKISISGDKPIYIGGIAGRANHVGFTSSIVGGATNSMEGGNYQDVVFNLAFNRSTGNVNFGGVAGYATRGIVAGCKAVVDASITGIVEVSEDSGNNLKFGGFMGVYSQDSEESINECSTRFNIKFAVGADKKLTALGSVTQATNTMISSGIADLDSGSSITRCLFTGEINTEGAELKNVYAGSIAAYNATQNPVQISEVNTNTIMCVGTSATEKLYAGGMIGMASAVKITNSANWGRIIPITSNNAEDIYVGGIIGKIQQFTPIGGNPYPVNINVQNAYSTASIILDSVAPKSIAEMKTGALLGGMGDDITYQLAQPSNSNIIEFNSVFYSSDLALTADENAVNSQLLGTNYTVGTLLLDAQWHSQLKRDGTSMWKSINTQSIPYLINLEDAMKEYGILTKQRGTGEYSFDKGTIFNPYVITSDEEYTFENRYSYYLLNPETDTTSISTKGTLVGILIGAEKNILTSKVLVGEVEKHSAISNVHINLEKGEFEAENVITKTNNGVIFNCSVQGTGVEASALKGVIAGTNAGLISHSYSGVEVIKAGHVVSGIVSNNEYGKLLSNYFTGYIETSNSIAAYGIAERAGTDETKSYMYNNYMAGVVKAKYPTKDSYFAGNGGNGVDKIAGSNNYVDTFSDIQFSTVGYNSLTLDKQHIIKPISTNLLMTEGTLAGKWHYAAKNETNATLDTSALTFGYNYNYPVYKFNKVDFGATGEVAVTDNYDTRYLLYTGTGEVQATADNSKESRYNDMLSLNQQYKNYEHSFKISHLGVLASAMSLVENGDNAGRNYMFIYNIDGAYEKDNTKQHFAWTYSGDAAAGEDVFINGFKTTNFSGVVTSNKYYDYNEVLANKDQSVEIGNLSNNGLFNVVGDAYFGNITLGSFSNLVKSGALAVSTTKTAGQGGEKTEIITNNIKFVKDSMISGNAEGEDNYFGALFGTVHQRLVVKNFKSVNGSTVLVSLSAAENTNAGLIAGACDGEIILSESGAENSSTFFANISGGNYVGGVVGVLSSGCIYGEGNTINIYDNTQLEGNQPKIIGGIAGLAEKLETSESDVSHIVNIKVNIVGNNDEIKINTNSFGGVVGEVRGCTVNVGLDDNTSETTMFAGVSDAAVDVEIALEDTKSIIFETGSLDRNYNYYGLAVGYINDGCVNLNKFNLNITETTIKVVSNADDDDNIIDDALPSDSACYGVGTFVGAMVKTNNDSTGLHFNSSQKEFDFNLTLRSEAIPNVGGVIGLYGGGALDLAISFANPLILEGSTNVGGVIGYIKGAALLNVVGDENVETLLTSENSKSAIVHALPGENIGGLIGRWDGNPDEIIDDEFPKIINNNLIYMEYLELDINDGLPEMETVKNVGGVVGLLNATTNVSNLINNGTIDYGNKIDEDSLSNLTDELSTEDSVLAAAINSSGTFYRYISAVNVGGIIGKLTAAKDGGATVSQLSNTGSIAGYQNVGGLIGLIPEEEKTITLTGCGVTLPSDAEKLSYDGTNLNAEQVEHAVSGNIKGVMNVGGAVGMAEGEHTISCVAVNADVMGNINIGGLVGKSNKATLKNNIVDDSDGDIEIKALYYNVYDFVEDEDMQLKLTLMKSIIPTSVGGLVGSTNNSTVSGNVIRKITISSALEGGDGETISTIKNHMLNGENIGDDYYEIKTDSSDNITRFNNIKTGYGGMFGTTDDKSMTNSLSDECKQEIADNPDGIDAEKFSTGNYIIDLKINAQLGVNVGTYYGVVRAVDQVWAAPEAYGEISVDGGYMSGGVIGYVDAYITGGAFPVISNKFLPGNATIKLQENLEGMYVGGLIGKTTYYNINELSMHKIESGVNIQIYSDKDYYVGGLIGRAEVCVTDATINGTFDDDKDSNNIVIGDQVNNFGAFIGMLKVGVGTGAMTVNVTGEHYKAFTINTIENENYYDGDSRFFLDDDDKSQITLAAEAYYVNKDTLNICGTSEESWHDKYATNPTNNKARGWALEYTGFKQMQRCIPQIANNGANWDSIAVLYDAAQITHVGTIENLNLGDTNLKTRVKRLNADLSEPTIITDVVKGSELGDDHICFTVYEQSPGMATLYSAMGIAHAVLNGDEDVDKMYADVKNDIKPFLEYVIKNASTLYIDCNNNSYFNSPEENDYTMSGLTYFNWRKTNYKTVGKDTSAYQWNSDNAVEMVYFVENYLSCGKNNEKYATYQGQNTSIKDKGFKGVNFVFDVVYENASMNGLSYKDKNREHTIGGKDDVPTPTDALLPMSGSMFAVCGIYSNTAYDARHNEGVINWKSIIADIIITIGLTILAVAVPGSQLGWFILKESLKQAVKTAVAWVVKWAASSAVKKAIAYGLAMVTFMAWAYYNFGTSNIENGARTYANFVLPNATSIGYLSSSYLRDISYEKDEDGKLIARDAIDAPLFLESGTYYAYSTVRPKDYFGTYLKSEVTITTEQPNSDIIKNISFGDFITTTEELPEIYPTKYQYDGSTFELYDIGGSHYYIADKYVYHQGMYYIHERACDVEQYRVTLSGYFDKGTYYNDSNIEQPYLEPHYLTVNNNIYNSGTYNYENGRYNYNQENGNLIEKSGNNYTLNGRTLSQSEVEYNSRTLNYVYSESKPKDARDGYTWFNYAYYTRNGEGTGAPSKYACFKAQTSIPSGIDGVDYFSGSYLKEPDERFKQDNNGMYDKDGNRYTDLTDVKPEDRYSLVPDTVVSCYWVLQNEAFIDSYSKPDDYNYLTNKYFEVYPSTFKNPYTKYSNLKNSDTTKTSYGWKQDSRTNAAGIKFAPTYYLWEGGYTPSKTNAELLDKGYVFTQVAAYKPDSNDEQDKATQEGFENINIYICKYTGGGNTEITLDGSVTSTNLHDIFTNWETYKTGWCIVSESNKVKSILDETYQVIKDETTGKLYIYQINTNFTLNNSFLNRLVVTQDRGEAGNYNMYLTNSDYGLYTRYKYGVGDNIFTFAESASGNAWQTAWKDNYLVPNSNSLNAGNPTRFSESCKVILGQVGTKVKLKADNDTIETSGSINVS